MWGWPAPPAGRPAPGPICQPPRCYIGFLSPPRMHLCRFLSQFDLRAHVASFGLYIPGPAPTIANKKNVCWTKILIFWKLITESS
jgi:hypothetical protein